MRVLLVSPAYRQTYWSFDRVLRMLKKDVLLPPLGLITVAALLPESWRFRLVDAMIAPVSQEDWDECDVVMITGMVTQHSGILNTVRQARKMEKRVVVGGPLAFHIPEEMLEAGADIVVKGELENAVPGLLQALEDEASGIVIEAEERPDLTEAPPPRYDLLQLEHYVDVALQFSRGCPFHCEFCDITLMFGRKVRTKTPEQILHELQVLYDLGWRRAVFFVDDNFIGNPFRARELLEVLIPWMEERGYPFDFYTQASVDLAKNDELLDMMVRAGFNRVFLGIETTDLESLKLTKKFQNAATDLDRACRTINRAGLQIIAGCIIGFDNEQAGADERLIAFAERNNIAEMFITLLHAAPGTDLWKRLGKEGRLLQREFDDDFGNQLGTMNFVTTRSSNEIISEFVALYDHLYDPPQFLERTYNHFRNMAPLPFKKASRPPRWNEIRAVLIMFYRQGVLSGSRLLFWKYLFSALRRFPDRVPNYLAACVTAEHYYEYREKIIGELGARTSQESESAPMHEATAVAAGTRH